MRLLPGFVLLLLMMFVSGCYQNKQDHPVRIGSNNWFGYEPLHYAKAAGYYKTSVKMVELASASEVLRAYKNNTLEVVGLTLDEVILLRSKGFNPVIVAILDTSNGGDVIIAQKEFKTMHSLKGKRVGLENTALGAYVISRALELNQMQPGDVKIIPLEFNEHEQAFNTHQVDAVVTFEPVKSHLLEKESTLLFSSKEIPHEIVDVLVVSEHAVQNHYTQVQDIVNGVLRAQSDLRQKEEKIIQFIGHRNHLSDEEMKVSLEGITVPTAKENLLQLKNLTPTINKLHQAMLAKKLIEHDVDTHRLINTQFLQKALN